MGWEEGGRGGPARGSFMVLLETLRQKHLHFMQGPDDMFDNDRRALKLVNLTVQNIRKKGIRVTSRNHCSKRRIKTFGVSNSPTRQQAQQTDSDQTGPVFFKFARKQFFLKGL